MTYLLKFSEFERDLRDVEWLKRQGQG